MTIVGTLTSSDDHHRRFERYRSIDRSLAQQTRFFGAAAVITEALCYLTGTAGRMLVSMEARSFLATLGADLEELNIRIARSIDCGTSIQGVSLRAPSLDARIVNLEQSHVQERLRDWQQRAPGVYGRIVGELDRLLAMLRFSPVRRSGGWEILKSVLGMLRTELCRPLEFGRQADREAIGNAIIAALRGANPRITVRA